MQLAVPKLNSVTLHYLESCVGCGTCEHSCPFFYFDPKYGPAEKAELIRQILRTRYTVAGRLLGPLVGAKMPKTQEELWELLDYAYKCTNCGHCYATCTYGIDSGAMVRLLRQTLYTVGLAPTVLKRLAEFETKKLYLGQTELRKMWEDFLKVAEAPVGKKGANVLLFISLGDVIFSKDALLNTIKILKRVGEDFTLPERPLGIRPPIADVVGDVSGTKEVVADVVSYIESLSPKVVVTIDGGYVYSYLRFEATNILKKKFSFKVLHITELLYEYILQGRLKLKRLNTSVAWHDPCQLGRRGGVFKEPRELLKRIVDLKELPHNKMDTVCSGGCEVAYLTKDVYSQLSQILGINLDPADEREKKILETTEEAYRVGIRRKMEDIKKSGARLVVTACPMSINAIRLGGKLYGVDVEVEDIVNLVAKALE